MPIQVVDWDCFLGYRDIVLGIDQRHILLPPGENVIEEEVTRGLAGVRDVAQNLKSVFEAPNL